VPRPAAGSRADLPRARRPVMVAVRWVARSGLFVSDIFREIDEELRRDNLLKLWSRYRRYIIGAAVAVMLVAGGIAAWRSHEVSQRQVEATRYAGALSLAESGKTADAIRVFAAIAGDGGGYGLLARFEEAGLEAKSGDHKAAAALYDRIAADAGVDSDFRRLAVILAVMQGMQEKPAAGPQQTIARLAPLTAPGDPWRPSALELTALARLEAGDSKGALALYKSLADDLAAPRSLRARAAEMVAALSS
jgi:hypothetical protein